MCESVVLGKVKTQLLQNQGASLIQDHKKGWGQTSGESGGSEAEGRGKEKVETDDQATEDEAEEDRRERQAMRRSDHSTSPPGPVLQEEREGAKDHRGQQGKVDRGRIDGKSKSQDKERKGEGAGGYNLEEFGERLCDTDHSAFPFCDNERRNQGSGAPEFVETPQAGEEEEGSESPLLGTKNRKRSREGRRESAKSKEKRRSYSEGRRYARDEEESVKGGFGEQMVQRQVMFAPNHELKVISRNGVSGDGVVSCSSPASYDSQSLAALSALGQQKDLEEAEEKKKGREGLRIPQTDRKQTRGVLDKARRENEEEHGRDRRWIKDRETDSREKKRRKADEEEQGKDMEMSSRKGTEERFRCQEQDRKSESERLRDIEDRETEKEKDDAALRGRHEQQMRKQERYSEGKKEREGSKRREKVGDKEGKEARETPAHDADTNFSALHRTSADGENARHWGTEHEFPIDLAVPGIPDEDDGGVESGPVLVPLLLPQKAPDRVFGTGGLGSGSGMSRTSSKAPDRAGVGGGMSRMSSAVVGGNAGASGSGLSRGASECRPAGQKAPDRVSGGGMGHSNTAPTNRYDFLVQICVCIEREGKHFLGFPFF